MDRKEKRDFCLQLCVTVNINIMLWPIKSLCLYTSIIKDIIKMTSTKKIPIYAPIVSDTISLLRMFRSTQIISRLCPLHHSSLIQ